MQSLRNKVLLLSMLIAGVLLLGGCGESTCAHSCGSSDGCPDVSGSYYATMQVHYDYCELGWFTTNVTITVSQNPLDDMTYLSIGMDYGAFTVMEGELCNTSDSTFPKKYHFGASGTIFGDDYNLTDYIGGDFVFFEGGTIDICGSLSTSAKIDDETCNSSASIYTSTSTCD